MGAEPPSFGDLLRKFRFAAGFSQEGLAERAGISVAAVGTLERGARRAPHRETLALLAKALELTEREHADLKLAATRAAARITRRGASAVEPAHNLPTQLTSFIGREDDISAICMLLGKHRLVTIMGSGGVGKTRLALEVAGRLFASRHEEAWFVDLAPLSDGTFIVSSVAAVLALPFADGALSIAALASALKAKNMLLILDNCEHLTADVAAVVRTIVQHCPSMVILATSRERLGIVGEATYRLPSLTLPDETPTTLERARSFAALDLFVQRAEGAETAFVFTSDRIAIVTEICRQLDGIPLAIELAAARLPMLGLTALHARLGERFVLAGGGRDLPPRQQTMLGTIAWSFSLLSEPERVLLRRLAVFAGGHSLEVAEAVCSDEIVARSAVPDILASLVDKSLVDVALAGDTPRYSLLNSARSFAFEKLAEAGESTLLRRRHAEWLANFADRAQAGAAHVPKLVWLADAIREIDNVRCALEWTLGVRAHPDSAADTADANAGGRIIVGLRSFWLWSLQLVECRRWVEVALQKVDEEQHPIVVAQLLLLLSKTTRGPASLLAAERALPLFERVSDRRSLAQLHVDLGYKYARLKRYGESEAATARALAFIGEENMELSPTYGSLLLTRSVLHSAQDRFDAARADIARAEALGRALGDEYFVAAWCTAFAAEVEFCAGNTRGAAAIVERTLAAKRAVPGYEAVVVAHLADLAVFRLVLGETDVAKAAATDVLRRPHGRSQVETSLQALQCLAAVVALDGNPIPAARLLGFADLWSAREDYWRSGVEHRAYEILIASVTQQLGANVIAALRAEGAMLSLDRAVDEALAVGA
jgi:predicted ATPase/DNA-binding XRE family transcriptional regulator